MRVFKGFVNFWWNTYLIIGLLLEGHASGNSASRVVGPGHEDLHPQLFLVDAEAVVICHVKVGFVVVMIAFNPHVRDQVDVGTAVGLMVPE